MVNDHINFQSIVASDIQGSIFEDYFPSYDLRLAE